MSEKGLIIPEQYKEAGKYYLENILGPAEFFTGLVGSNRSQVFQSVGHAVQGLLSGKFLQILQQEYSHYRESGKIKEDFRYTDQNQMCFTELLRFLEQEMPDKDRFELLKRIYIVSATEKVFDRNSHVPLQFMQIARELNSGEMLVLSAAHRIAKEIPEEKMPESVDWRTWVDIISKEAGLLFREIVNKHETTLVEKNLLEEREVLTGNYNLKPFFRLTRLGYAFCEYVSQYDHVEDGQINFDSKLWEYPPKEEKIEKPKRPWTGVVR